MSTGRLGAGDTAIQPTILDAKGDLLTATAGDTPARLAVGANDTVLTADSSTATGLKWATPSLGLKGSSVYNSANYTIANDTWTVLNFDSESWDSDSFHSTSSNTSRLTVPAGLGGTYLIKFICYWTGNATGKRIISFQKNNTNATDGTELGRANNNAAGADATTQYVYAIVSLVATDYVTVRVQQNRGGNLDIISAPGYTEFSMIRLGA